VESKRVAFLIFQQSFAETLGHGSTSSD
jgi:hypothetical protein